MAHAFTGTGCKCAVARGGWVLGAKSEVAGADVRFLRLSCCNSKEPARRVLCYRIQKLFYNDVGCVSCPVPPAHCH